MGRAYTMGHEGRDSVCELYTIGFHPIGLKNKLKISLRLSSYMIIIYDHRLRLSSKIIVQDYRLRLSSKIIV